MLSAPAGPLRGHWAPIDSLSWCDPAGARREFNLKGNHVHSRDARREGRKISVPLRPAQLQKPGENPARRGVQHPARFPARPGPDHSLQIFPPAQAQDPGVPDPRRGPLPHPSDPHPGGFPDRPDHGQGPLPERRADRGDRPGARSGPYPFRPCRGRDPERDLPGRIPPFGAEPAGGGPFGKRRERTEPHVGGPGRDSETLQRKRGPDAREIPRICP